MRTWIIQQKQSKETRYETKRLVEEGGANTEVILHPNVDIMVSRDDRRSIWVKNKLVTLPDVIIPRTGSGTGYFGFAILRHLERLGVPTVNHSDSIEAAKDKLYAHQLFAQQHLPTPKTVLVRHPVNADLVDRLIGWPAVVKIMAGSYGKGVYQVTSRARFQDFIDFAHGIKTDEAIIVQEYIDTAPGECKALALEVAGVDLLFGKNGGYLICEANSAPGFEGFEKATGVNVAQEIIKYAHGKARANK
jgi:gamma-F420-2:alpha-L-glutamate ligase